MVKYFKRVSVLALILSLSLTLFSSGVIASAEQDKAEFKDIIYSTILPGQTVSQAHKLYDGNPSYLTSETDISGQNAYTVEAISEEAFSYFGIKANKIGFIYDKTKGKIIHVGTNIFLENCFGSDLTDLLSDVLDQMESYGEPIRNEIKDTSELYVYKVTIDNTKYDFTIFTKWGKEGATNIGDQSHIDFRLSSESNTPETPTAAPQTANTGNPTLGEKNALKAADNYLSFMGFSYEGLIQQLIMGNGFSETEARYAADNCGADWKEQAVKCAQNYLSIMSFSRSGLIQQLMIGNKFTEEEAIYAADQVGY